MLDNDLFRKLVNSPYIVEEELLFSSEWERSHALFLLYAIYKIHEHLQVFLSWILEITHAFDHEFAPL